GSLAAATIHRPTRPSSWAAPHAEARDVRLSFKDRLGDDRPVASANGICVSIALAEPFLFFQGFEQGDHAAARSTAMLRGRMILRITKPTKIKAVTLRFRGRAVTKWPEGIPPKKTEFEEVNTNMSHTWPFFNAQFPTAEGSTGADNVELHPSTDSNVARNRSSLGSLEILSRNPASTSNPNLRESKRLSLQVTQRREPSPAPNNANVAQKGYRTFQAGEYTYNFELPLDSHLPETINVELGSVKYELEATVERSGAFRPNLVGTKEVSVVRIPAEGSLEQVEPIAISRNWEDQLHYDIVISGKSFPLGAQVPIAFKLTPLAKVQCHRIKVFVTESVEYYASNRRVHRLEPPRKVLLFEKRADAPPTSTFPGSTMRIVSGGGVPYDLRAAAARGEEVPAADSNNLLGNLERDANNAGPTELEFSVQLPGCGHTANRPERDKNLRLHFDTTYANIQVHHWIKIVLRLSRPDTTDPSRRRHFEISIDSPFHILDCRATQANISLPAYERGPSDPHAAESSSAVPIRSLTPARPAAAHISPHSQTEDGITELDSSISSMRDSHPSSAHQSSSRTSGSSWQSQIQAPLRPMHFIRAPSFNPPGFDEEEPPPPLETPPPRYDSIVQSPGSGLADYFSRLSDA
ncbi:hypothetical protein EJ06DRAFT_461710, partial [Trichodelitschia bisporula]